MLCTICSDVITHKEERVVGVHLECHKYIVSYDRYMKIINGLCDICAPPIIEAPVYQIMSL